MNREIKFRGLHKSGEWLIGYFTTYDGVSYIKSIDRDQRFGCGIDVRPETVGQYTGLKDSNGVEIYEGDIVDLPHWEPRRWLIDYSVEQGAFYFRHQIEQPYDVCNPMRYLDRATVIGNIFENPELLEAK